MKISNSKKELARIISENGGWRDGFSFSAQDGDDFSVWFYRNKPSKGAGRVWRTAGDCERKISCTGVIQNWHQTILSRAEYFHLYQAPDTDGWIEFDGTERPSGYFNKMIDAKLKDGRVLTDLSGRFEWDTDGPSSIIAYRMHKPEQAKPEFCESVMRSIPEPEAKPNIEQLAADYRNARDLAERKQQEADAAKADEDARLKALELACEALGLKVSPIAAKQEPELVITDWRDLRVGDIVWVDAYDGHDEGEWPVNQMEGASYSCDYAFSVKNGESCERWVDVTNPWRFIRRP